MGLRGLGLKEKINRSLGDAPLTKAGKLLLQFFHTALMLCLLLLAGRFLWSSVLQPWSTGAETVLIMGEKMDVVMAPENGIFRRAAPLHHGTRVQQGAVLGTIASNELSEERRRLEVEIEVLSETLLQYDPRLLSPDFTDAPPEMRQMQTDLGIRMHQATARLKHLDSRIEQLCVRAPTDGTIYFDVADYQVVERDSTIIAQIWPTGAGVFVEIDASLPAVLKIVEQKVAHCKFATPNGSHLVDIQPHAETLRTFFLDDTLRQRRRKWASIKCTAGNLPDDLRRPGIVGSLE